MFSLFYLLKIMCVFLLFKYLGSMLVKELRGTESTQDACAKMRVSLNLLLLQNTIVASTFQIFYASSLFSIVYPLYT